MDYEQIHEEYEYAIVGLIASSLHRRLPNAASHIHRVTGYLRQGRAKKGPIQSHVFEIFLNVREQIYTDFANIEAAYKAIEQDIPFEAYLKGAIDNKVLQQLRRGAPSNREVLRYIVERERAERRRYWIGVLKNRWYNRLKRALLANYSEPDLFYVTHYFFDAYIPHHYDAIRADPSVGNEDVFELLVGRYEAFLREQTVTDIQRQLEQQHIITPRDPQTRTIQGSTPANAEDESSEDQREARVEREPAGPSVDPPTTTLNQELFKHLDLLIRCRNPGVRKAKAELTGMLGASEASSGECRDVELCLAYVAVKEQAVADNAGIQVRNLRIHLVHQLSRKCRPTRWTKTVSELSTDDLNVQEVVGGQYTLADVCRLFGMPNPDPNITGLVRDAANQQVEQIDCSTDTETEDG